jgi:hypothetical protein
MITLRHFEALGLLPSRKEKFSCWRWRNCARADSDPFWVYQDLGKKPLPEVVEAINSTSVFLVLIEQKSFEGFWLPKKLTGYHLKLVHGYIRVDQRKAKKYIKQEKDEQ